MPEQPRLVPIGFAEDSLGDALERAGCGPEQITCFLAEAVTQYLDEAAVRCTFGFLSQAAPGSRLIFTHIRGEFLDGSEDVGLGLLRTRLGGKNPRWLVGMGLEEVVDFVERDGLRVLSNAGSAEIDARCVNGQSRSFALTDLEPSAALEKAS